VLEEWTATIEEGLDLDIIYLDFKKAFDTFKSTAQKTDSEIEKIQHQLQNH
jgi:hypothetical protein